jgi:hypothetical protein
MADEEKDVIRVQDIEANLLVGVLRNGMIAEAADTGRLIYARLDTGARLGYSDDTRQVLIDDTKTITAAKTFSAGVSMTSTLNVTGVAVLILGTDIYIQKQ